MQKLIPLYMRINGKLYYYRLFYDPSAKHPIIVKHIQFGIRLSFCTTNNKYSSQFTFTFCSSYLLIQNIELMFKYLVIILTMSNIMFYSKFPEEKHSSVVCLFESLGGLIPWFW